MVTALDELRVLDERRRAELRAAEEAEVLRRTQTEAAVRERMEAEEELRRQQRSRAEAQAWADAQREVEAVRARHAAEDKVRIEAIEAEAIAKARARLAEERADSAQQVIARPRRGWMLAAGLLAAAVLGLGFWGRQQAAELDEAIAARTIAQRAAEDASSRADRLTGDLRATRSRIDELRQRFDELSRLRMLTPATTTTAPKPGPRPTTRPATGPGPRGPLTVCTDSPLC